MGTINVPTQEQRDARLMQLAAKKLAAKKHPDEVADLLCKTGDIYWNAATEIVDEVRYNRRGMIAMYQLPSAIIKSVLYAALGVFLLLLGGRVLITYGLPTPFLAQLQNVPVAGGVSFYGANAMHPMLNLIFAGAGAFFLLLAVLGIVQPLLIILLSPVLNKSRVIKE